MQLLRNIFAVIGVVSLLAILVISVKGFSFLEQLDEFDPDAKAFYSKLWQRVIDNHSGVDAMVVKVPANEGLTADEIDASIRYIANELNVKNVGELPMYKEVESLSGTPFRYVKIYLLCDAMTAASLLNYNDAFTSYLPCRITLLEDKSGKFWLYTMNMDIMIYGGRPLPPALKMEAIKVRDSILQIMNRASRGDF